MQAAPLLPDLAQVGTGNESERPCFSTCVHSPKLIPPIHSARLAKLAQLAQQEAGKRHVAAQTADKRDGRGQVPH
jgi:hypothetical protein